MIDVWDRTKQRPIIMGDGDMYYRQAGLNMDKGRGLHCREDSVRTSSSIAHKERASITRRAFNAVAIYCECSPSLTPLIVT